MKLEPMREPVDRRVLLHAVIPITVVVGCLATAPWWPSWLEAVSTPISLSQFLLLCGIATVAAVYAPLGRGTLGLGAAGLPLATWFVGPAWGGCLAGVAYLLAEILRRYVLRIPFRRADRLQILPSLADASRVVFAALIGSIVLLVGSRGGLGESPAALTLPAIGGATVSYVLVLWILYGIEYRWGERRGGWIPAKLVRASLLDVVGWSLGASIVPLVAAGGWRAGSWMLAVAAVLAAESARNLHLRKRAVARVGELWEVTRAGHRIIFRDANLATMARDVLEECRRVLPCHWFQFELLGEESKHQSWSAGPDGRIEEGLPSPADSPPALPGIHRRSSWRILQRQLKADGEPIAMLRFWCDPRRLEPTSIELLDSLLPQVAATVHRALLDRRAKQDPLTGLADRRELERRLDQVFADTHKGGGSMAVVMCDLDRFKDINDAYGHDSGDRALLEVVGLLEEHRREADLCSRYGGEEFALVLEKTEGLTGLRVAERLRRAVERHRFEVAGRQVPLSVSLGVAAYPELHVKAGKELLILADEALMEAKRRGRNRSLLHLGRGRFQTAAGEALDQDEKPPEDPMAPTLFA